jgi:hypothetical protein
MLRKIKNLAKNTRLYDFVRSQKQKKALKEWETSFSNKYGLPHILKQFTVKDYAYKFDCQILIETGTFEGDMVSACKNSFKSVFSIELDKYLYECAVDRFRHDLKVKIVHGDSSIKLNEILNGIKSPCVFWLDGHYSAGTTAKGELETPIAREIELIFDHPIKEHVILIDDARCFNGSNDYPVLELFIKEIQLRRRDVKIEVYNDIIRITPDKTIIKK